MIPTIRDVVKLEDGAEGVVISRALVNGRLVGVSVAVDGDVRTVPPASCKRLPRDDARATQAIASLKAANRRGQ